MGCTLGVDRDEAGYTIEEKERDREKEFTAVPSAEVEAEGAEKVASPTDVADVGPVLVFDDGEESSGRKRNKQAANHAGNSPSPSSPQNGGIGKTPQSSLDHLRTVVTNMKVDVDNRIKQHMQPSEDQLTEFVGKISAVLKTLAGKAPLSIKKAVTNSFQLCGYEFVTGVVVSRTKFTLHFLGESLKFLASQLNSWAPSPTPTPEEAADITKAAKRLWELDGNRLKRGVDYELNIQCEKSAHNHSDTAPEPLFTYIDEDVFERPTFKAFRNLLDNYNATLGYSDTYTKTERDEMEIFMLALKETQVMQYCHSFLVRNKKAPASYDRFMQQVYLAWFTLYKRKVDNDSSGFEHVFLGERDDQKKTVSGLHNWIQIAMEEKNGKLDYKGKIRGSRHYAEAEQFLTIQFEWCGQEKYVSSSLIGTSPEFELALLSMCFFNGKEDTPIHLGPHHLSIKCYTIRRRGKKYIGSAFPEPSK